MIRYPDLGVAIPHILLPGPAIDHHKWSVVACDQFTSQPEYWRQVAEIVGDAPSAYHLILPEVDLGGANETRRIEAIHRRMREYLNAGHLTRHGPCIIAVRRRTAEGRVRKGLVLAVDLECYDFQAGAGSLIRATEGTVLERIPPRIRIRDGAALELPHIMVLMDDPQDKVWGALGDIWDNCSKVYDFELMLGGGAVAGFKIENPSQLAGVVQEFKELAAPVNFDQKYGLAGAKPLLFAVGDGNHSLATAKVIWDRIKAGAADGVDLTHHPARYALVEVVNIHDSGLVFEPIHRVVFGVNPDTVFQAMNDYFSRLEMRFTYHYDSASWGNPIGSLGSRNPDLHRIGFVSDQGVGFLEILSPHHNLEVGTLQGFLDDLVAGEPRITVDYIHGDRVVAELGRRPGNMGFFLPGMAKKELFKTVIRHGVLPRKTFSMGMAEEKRYYLECRQICY